MSMYGAEIALCDINKHNLQLNSSHPIWMISKLISCLDISCTHATQYNSTIHPQFPRSELRRIGAHCAAGVFSRVSLSFTSGKSISKSTGPPVWWKLCAACPRDNTTYSSLCLCSIPDSVCGVAHIHTPHYIHTYIYIQREQYTRKER
jgi:hypothetical protein